MAASAAVVLVDPVARAVLVDPAVLVVPVDRAVQVLEAPALPAARVRLASRP